MELLELSCFSCAVTGPVWGSSVFHCVQTLAQVKEEGGNLGILPGTDYLLCLKNFSVRDVVPDLTAALIERKCRLLESGF